MFFFVNVSFSEIFVILVNIVDLIMRDFINVIGWIKYFEYVSILKIFKFK